MDSYLLGHSGGFQDHVNQQEATYLPTELMDYIPQPREQDVRDEGFEQKLRTFVSRKRDFLSEPNDVDDEQEVHTIGNDDDKYAKMPPLESFMGLSPEICRQHFFTSLERKDALIGVVKSVIDSGLVMSVLCMDNGKARDIDELKVTAFCPAKELPRMFPHQSPIEGFQVKDKVRGLVLNVNPATEKVIITMLDRTMSDDCCKIKLGLINEDDFPVHYRRKLHIRGLTFDELLHSIVGFNNSNNVPCLLDTLHLSDTTSLMTGLHRLKIPDKEYAEQLRRYQSQKWAHQNVVNGVSMFKAGKQVEAMQYLNKALQIDKKNVEALVARGALYANNESYHKAIEDFEEALEMNPQHQNARMYLSETVLTLAKIDEDHGNYEGAERHYRKAQQLQPNSVEIRELLRFMFVRKERKERELRSESSRTSSRNYPDDRSSPKSERLERTTQTLKKLIHEDKKGHRDSRKRRGSPSMHSPNRKRHKDKSSHRYSPEEYDQFRNPDSTAEENMRLKQELERRAEERRRLDESPSQLFGIDHKASFLFGQDGNYRTSPPKNIFSREQSSSETRERRNRDPVVEQRSDFDQNSRKSRSHKEDKEFEDLGKDYSREMEHKEMHRHREGMDWEERDSFEMFRKGDNSASSERISNQKQGHTSGSDYRNEHKVKRGQSSSSSSSDSSSDSDSSSSGSSSSSDSSRYSPAQERGKTSRRDSNEYADHQRKKVSEDKYQRSENTKSCREADKEKIDKRRSIDRDRRRELNSKKYDEDQDKNYTVGKDLSKEKKKKKYEQYDEVREQGMARDNRFSPKEIPSKSSRKRSKESMDRKSPIEEPSKTSKKRYKDNVDRRSLEKSARQSKEFSDEQSSSKGTPSRQIVKEYTKDSRGKNIADTSGTSKIQRDKESKRNEEKYRELPKGEGSKPVQRTDESRKDTPSSKDKSKVNPTPDKKSGYSFHMEDSDGDDMPKAQTPVIDKLMKSKWDSPSDEKYYKEIKVTTSGDKRSSRFDLSPKQIVTESRKQNTLDNRIGNEKKHKEDNLQQAVKSSKELELKKKDTEKKINRMSEDLVKKVDKVESSRQSKLKSNNDKTEEIRTLAKSDTKISGSSKSRSKSKQSDSDWSEEERKITKQGNLDKKAVESRNRKNLGASQETRSMKLSRQPYPRSPRSDSSSPERNTSAEKHKQNDINIHKQSRSNEGLRIHITNDRFLPTNRDNSNSRKAPSPLVHSSRDSIQEHSRSRSRSPRSKDRDSVYHSRHLSRRDNSNRDNDNSGKSKKRHSSDWYEALARRQNRDRSRESPTRSDNQKSAGSSHRSEKQNLPDVIPSAKVKGGNKLTVSREYCGRNVFSTGDEHESRYRSDSRYRRSPRSRSSSSDSSSSSSYHKSSRNNRRSSDHRSLERRRSRSPGSRKSRTPDRRRSRTPGNSASKTKFKGQRQPVQKSPGARPKPAEESNVIDSKRKFNPEEDKALNQMEQFLNQLKEKKKEQSSATKVKPW